MIWDADLREAPKPGANHTYGALGPDLDHGEWERPLGHECGAKTSEGGELLGSQAPELLELVPQTELQARGWVGGWMKDCKRVGGWVKNAPLLESRVRR